MKFLVKIKAISLFLCFVFLASSAHAAYVQSTKVTKNELMVRVFSSEKHLRVGDIVKLSAVHGSASGYIVARDQKVIRVRVRALGILKRGTKVKVAKLNRGLTNRQKGKVYRIKRDRLEYGGGFKGGFLFNDRPGIGGEAVYNISTRLQLGVFAGQSEDERSQDFSRDKVGNNQVKQFDVSASLITLQGKYFLTSNLYLLGGAGVRTVKGSALVGDGFEEAVHFAGVESYVLQAGLGNLWIFGNGFYIGAEWGGLVQPISSKKFRSVKRSGEVSQESTELGYKTEDKIFKLGQSRNFNIGLLQIGMLF